LIDLKKYSTCLGFKDYEIVYNCSMPLDIHRIKALCFDVDGTLSDTDDYYVNKFSTWLRYVPLIRDRERVARRLVMWAESPGNALLGFTDTIGLDGEVIALIDWIYRHRRNRVHPYLVVPGVAEMLSRLKERYPLAVVSARDENTTMAFLEQFDLVKNFNVIITALSAKHTKPYPDPIRLAAEKMGVQPDACLMTGDTTVDIRAGKSAGAQTVGVLCGFGEESELYREGADLILNNTADLDQVLSV
jgi:phosphoglycolate phosphatase-like HAD superfamily hydrolase